VTAPTLEEVDRAGEKVLTDGPIALAWLVDSHPGLHGVISEMVDTVSRSSPSRLYTVLKTVFVLGLNFGIRIGEARGERVS
jgi:hypothetical protein